MHIGNGDTPMKTEFWMVYGEGQRAPTYKHDTQASALAEAVRLSAQCPGITFYTLKARKAVLCVKPAAKGWRLKKPRPDPDDGIPF